MARSLLRLMAVVAALLVSLVWSRPARAQASAAVDGGAACPPGNLLRRAELVRWIDTAHATALLTDDQVEPEGASWLSQAVVFLSEAGSLTYDLGAELPIRALYLQADAADRFALLTSKDGKTWQGYDILEVPEAAGMRARSTRLEGVTARFVRFGEPRGGGSHAATELQLFCEVPADAAPAPARRVLARDPDPDTGLGELSGGARLWLALTGAPWLTEVQAGAARLALALAAAGLLLFGALARRGAAAPASPGAIAGPWQRRAWFPAAALVSAPPAFVAVAVTWPHGQGSSWSTAALALAVTAAAALIAGLRLASTGPFQGRGGAPTSLPRLRGALLLALAAASYTGYYNWGSYHFPDYLHHHDVFHYFTGAKYFRELGYQGLYRCASAAEAEDGFRRRVELRKIRDLGDNAIVDGAAALRAAQDCKKSFTPARWEAFRRDVAYFRDHTDPAGWERMLRDHGYNPSPLWTMTGAAIADLRPASRGFLGHGDSMWAGALGLLDPALLLVAFASIAWAFGWRTAAVAVVIFGCSPLSTYLWTGGAYLRQDWFAATVVGVCLLKKGRPALGGASLAYAALLRVFPLGFFVPVVLKLGATLWRERRLDRAGARLVAGALVAAALLVPLSGQLVGGLGAWPAFAQNIEKHAKTPSANLVGLRTALSLRPSTRAALLADPTRDDPFAPVREARRASFRQLLPVYVILVLGFVAALARAVRRTEAWWAVAALGLAVIPVMTDLSCYYLSFLTLGALFLEESEEVPIALLLLAAVGGALSLAIDAEDVRYACVSAAVVGFAAWFTWTRGRPGKASAVS